MKNLKVLSFLFVIAGLSLASCNSDGAKTAAADDVRAVPAAATTSNAAAAPTATPAEPAVPAGPLTTLEFKEPIFDFGEVMEGDKVSHAYEFTNTGSEPLIISNAKGSCGCTVPNWPRTPIAPGETGVIDVAFDSKNKGKVGGNPQSKRVTITANTDPQNTYLTIKGKVDKTEEAAAPAAQ